MELGPHRVVTIQTLIVFGYGLRCELQVSQSDSVASVLEPNTAHMQLNLRLGTRQQDNSGAIPSDRSLVSSR